MRQFPSSIHVDRTARVPLPVAVLVMVGAVLLAAVTVRAAPGSIMSAGSYSHGLEEAQRLGDDGTPGASIALASAWIDAMRLPFPGERDFIQEEERRLTVVALDATDRATRSTSSSCAPDST